MILTVLQIRESERLTMAEEPISSLLLMERAGTTFYYQLEDEHFIDEAQAVYIFCGPGNNGGDGLVVARLFAQNERYVHVVNCSFDKKNTDEFRANFDRLQQWRQERPDLVEISDFQFFIKQQHDLTQSVCIDAVFGIGLTRPVEGDFATVVDFINDSFPTVVAVDVPSGLWPDSPLPDNAVCVRATHTYTFQYMKWEFLLPMNRDVVGEVKVLDIGLRLPEALKRRVMPDETAVHVVDADVAAALRPHIDRCAHKGTFGHALLIAGSRQMPGAAVLSATAALRGGCGKLTVHTTPNVAAALPIALPEAIINADSCDDCVTTCHWENLDGLNAIAIGPGIGQAAKTEALLKDLLSEVHSPTLFDADALNLLAANKTLLADLPPRSILTPHPKEFDRLAGASPTHADRLQRLCQFACQYNVIVVLKGHNSVIAVPRDGQRCDLFINTTGNPGMGTAGSGDVLTGLMLGLLARTRQPEAAALLGTYIHGLAGDIALETESEESLIASDITRHIGRAFKYIETYLQ